MATENIQAGARIDVTTFNAYLDKTVEGYFAKDYVFSELQKRGRFAFNKGGKKIEGRVDFRKREPTPIIGSPTDITFESANYWKDYTFPWRGWGYGYKIDEWDKLTQQNTGKVQPTVLINIVDKLAIKASKDFMDALMPMVFDDGNAGSGTNLMGYDSMMGNTGVAITDSPCVAPSDTYGGLSTVLGNYGGDWTPGTGYGYPNGTGDYEFRFWSPLILAYTSTLLTTTTAGTHTWATQWQSALNYMMTYGDIFNRGGYDCVVMDPEMLRQAQDSLADKTRFVAKSQKEGVSVGWREFDFSGLKIVTQYGVPSGCAYGLRHDATAIWAMYPQLLKKSEDTDITESTDLVAIKSYCQMITDGPSNFAKLIAI
jgi:hypothetical protein